MAYAQCLQPVEDLVNAVLKGSHVHGTLAAQQHVCSVRLEIGVDLYSAPSATKIQEVLVIESLSLLRCFRAK